MRSALLISLLLILVLPTMVLPVAAAPNHPPWGSFVNSGGAPAGSTLVVDVTYKVTNDEDSGNFGYWALDDYNKHVQVWQVPDGTFYVVARYAVQWQTFAGAKSPGAGVTQTKDASGTFEGGYVATFAATGFVSSPAYSKFGNIGTFDFGGSRADILKQTYGAGQTGPTKPFSFLSAYFVGTTGFTQSNWGWTYHYRSETWNNYASATTGDIVV